MKLVTLFLTLCSFLCINVNATEIHDCSTAWTLIAHGRHEEANWTINKLWEGRCNAPEQYWCNPYGERSHCDVQGWLYYQLIMFYVNYKQDNQSEMQTKSEQIDQLIHLEFGPN